MRQLEAHINTHTPPQQWWFYRVDMGGPCPCRNVPGLPCGHPKLPYPVAVVQCILHDLEQNKVYNL